MVRVVRVLLSWTNTVETKVWVRRSVHCLTYFIGGAHGIERLFRDARAPVVMAPTSDVAYEFIGRALCGLEVF